MSSDRWRETNRAWKRLAAWFDDKVAGPGSRDRESDPLAALGDIGAVRRALDEVEMLAVRSARLRRSSWAEIATKLGVTRQAAWEKWRDFDEDVPGSRAASPGPVEETLSEAVAGEITRAVRRMRPSRTVDVPNVVGMSVHAAGRALAGCGLIAVGHEPGTTLGMMDRPGAVVTDQSPESGARVAPRTHVTLWVDPGEGGVREPRTPRPDPLPARKYLPDPAEEAVG